MRIFNPTGGLTYHLRARRYRDTLWAPFRQQISILLDAWNPPEKELLILGPSGGHTLPTDFLERFDRLYLHDPDRLAPWVFRANHAHIKSVEWSRRDLIFKNRRYEPELLLEELDHKPKAAVLFSNLLGQLPLLNGNLEAFEEWWTALANGLAKRNWFSYHDLFSFEGKANLPARLQPGEVVPQLVDWARAQERPLDLIDHGTSEILHTQSLPELANLTWRLTPSRVHIVGARYQNAQLARQVSPPR